MWIFDHIRSIIPNTYPIQIFKLGKVCCFSWNIGRSLYSILGAICDPLFTFRNSIDAEGMDQILSIRESIRAVNQIFVYPIYLDSESESEIAIRVRLG